MNYALALPEILLAVSCLLLLLGAAWGGDRAYTSINRIALGVLAATFVLAAQGGQGITFHDLFIIDGFRNFVKMLIVSAAAFALLLAPTALSRNACAKPEYPILVLLAVLGMMVMVSANDLISVYMGLELQNIALYILAGFRRDDRRSSEAALKYFTLSALSSCVLLFGMSLVYGFTGSTGFGPMAEVLAASTMQSAGLAVGFVLVCAGFAFKISAVPFHMWTPDVYEGVPSPVTAFFATAPKVAAFSLFALLLAGPFSGLSELWVPVLVVMAVASMVVGAFGGLLQTNIKRLMAYSAMLNMGTLLIGLIVMGTATDVTVQDEGLYGFLIYLSLYFAATMGVFAVVTLLSAKDEMVEKTQDFSGFAAVHPVLALALAACLFSLAGIPPLAGFVGKYFVLLAAVKADLVGLAIAALLASVVGAGYYLRIIKVMYFDKRTDSVYIAKGQIAHKALAGFLALFVVSFLFFPMLLLKTARGAVESLL